MTYKEIKKKAEKFAKQFSKEKQLMIVTSFIEGALTMQEQMKHND